VSGRAARLARLEAKIDAGEQCITVTLLGASGAPPSLLGVVSTNPQAAAEATAAWYRSHGDVAVTAAHAAEMRKAGVRLPRRKKSRP
jgi:hypothetical protein